MASSRQLPAAEPDADTMHDPDRKKGGVCDHERAVTVGCAEYYRCQPGRITGENDQRDARRRSDIHRPTFAPRHQLASFHKRSVIRWASVRATKTSLPQFIYTPSQSRVHDKMGEMSSL